MHSADFPSKRTRYAQQVPEGMRTLGSYQLESRQPQRIRRFVTRKLCMFIAQERDVKVLIALQSYAFCVCKSYLSIFRHVINGSCHPTV